jgi:PAS domain S-box-containing protein
MFPRAEGRRAVCRSGARQWDAYCCDSDRFLSTLTDWQDGLFCWAAGLRLALVMLALVAAGVVAQTPVETSRTIRVVMDNAYAPYSFQSDEGKLQGILIDQWQAWEKKTGIKVEIHAMDWGEALRRTRAGEFDVIDCIVETAERRDYFDFTAAYATIEASIFFRDDISGITDLASLKGFPVGVKAGDQHIDKLKENGVTTVILFQNNDAIIESAKQRKINVFVIDDPSALYLLNKAGIEGEFRHSAPIFRDELRRAVRKGDAALLRTVSEGFAAIEPGELKQIDEKWFGHTISRIGHYLITYLGYATALAVLLVAGLIGWNRTLRKKVMQRTAALSESEQRFRRLVELMPVAVYVCDTSGIIQMYNHRAVELWGREPKLGDPAQRYCASLRLWSPDGKLVPHEESKMAEVLRTGVEARDLEVVIERPDGSCITVLVNIAPLRNGKGELIGAMNCFQDVTQRKQAQEALRESETRFRQVAENISEVFWLSNPEATFIHYVSPAYEEIWGRSCDSLYAEPISWMDSIHPDDRERIAEGVRLQSVRGQHDHTYRIVRPDGSLRWIRDRAFPVRDQSGKLIRVAGIAEDVTERKEAEEQLEHSTHLLQTFSRRLFDVQEEERRHLARELHDEIGQALTAAKINLQSVTGNGDSANFARLQETTAILDRLLGQVRQISLDLRPSMLDDLGLVPALRSLLDQQGRRASVAVRFSAENIPEKLDPEIQTTCFRIAQEAITNALRHAHAMHVDVDLRRDDRNLRLVVHDNGIGFNVESAQAQALGLGLIGIKERAALVGGRAKIISSPNKGTTIEVLLPLTLRGERASRGLA